MVIVATGADASERNIGQIVGLPIAWDPDAETYLDAVPTAAASLSYNKNRAINNFFKGMKTEGVWDDVTNLYIPLFGQVEGGVNLKTPSQNIGFPASGAVATYSSNGILFLQAWATPVTLNTASFHGGVYNTTSNSDNTGSRVGMSVANGGRWISARRSGTNTSGAALDANYQATVSNRVGGVGLVLSSFNSTTKRVATIVDGEYLQNIPTATAPAFSSGVAWLGGTAVGASTFALASPIGLVTMGSELTQAKMAAYEQLSRSLITALMAA